MLKSLKWDESRAVSSTDTRATVLHRFVGNWEFTKVVTNHFWADLYLIEGLAIVYANDRSNHFGENDHIAEVSFDNCRLLPDRTVLFTFSQLLKKGLVFGSKTSTYASSFARGIKLSQLITNNTFEKQNTDLHAHIQKLIEIDSTVKVFSKRPPLLHLFITLKS